MRTLSILVMAAALVTGLFHVNAEAIDAVRGKQYSLSERHGPWMIMVASFRNVPEDRREEGLTADEAAQELVFELRKKGIPAYTYSQDAVLGRIETVDRLGREDERVFAAQRDMVCVIAGNYAGVEDATGQKTLQWIKAFTPEFMKQEKSGAIYRETPGRRGPLGGAFLTINPLLKPDQVVRKTISPEVARWNNSSAFPLMGSKHAYTLQVATFTGRQTTPLAGSKYNGNEAQFDRELKNESAYGLSRAGEDAEQLVAVLREKGVPAYVHHDRFQSIVAVGNFDSPNDPAIALLHREYAPKYKPHPESQQDVLMPESLVVPNANGPGGVPNVWVFDVSPQLIKVPGRN